MHNLPSRLASYLVRQPKGRPYADRIVFRVSVSLYSTPRRDGFQSALLPDLHYNHRMQISYRIEFDHRFLFGSVQLANNPTCRLQLNIQRGRRE